MKCEVRVNVTVAGPVEAMELGEELLRLLIEFGGTIYGVDVTVREEVQDVQR